jgi:hypothetical protein
VAKNDLQNIATWIRRQEDAGTQVDITEANDRDPAHAYSIIEDVSDQKWSLAIAEQDCFLLIRFNRGSNVNEGLHFAYLGISAEDAVMRKAMIQSLVALGVAMSLNQAGDIFDTYSTNSFAVAFTCLDTPSPRHTRLPL